MKINQLNEGQVEQIETLRPNTVLRAYLPMSLKSALELVKYGLDSRPGAVQHEVTGKGVVGVLSVERDLSRAAGRGQPIVVGTVIRGKNLYPAYVTSELKAKADKLYPRSFNPPVSYLLLHPGGDDQVLLNAQIHPEDVTRFHLVGFDEDGFTLYGNKEVTASYDTERFLQWYVIYRGRRVERMANMPPGGNRLQQAHRASRSISATDLPHGMGLT